MSGLRQPFFVTTGMTAIVEIDPRPRRSANHDDRELSLPLDRGGVEAFGDHWQRIGQSIARAEPINPHTRFREKCHDRQRIRRTIPGLSAITA
jgi:hypothetical protein